MADRRFMGFGMPLKAFSDGLAFASFRFSLRPETPE